MDSNKLLNLRKIEKETLANRLVTVKDSKKIKKLLKNRFFPLNEYQKVSRNNLNTLRKGKKFNKLSKKEEQYYEFLYDFLFKIDTNIVEIAKGLKQLIGKKNLMPSIFLLRGMMEIIFFNIFVLSIYIKGSIAQIVKHCDNLWKSVRLQIMLEIALKKNIKGYFYFICAYFKVSNDAGNFFCLSSTYIFFLFRSILHEFNTIKTFQD